MKCKKWTTLVRLATICFVAVTALLFVMLPLARQARDKNNRPAVNEHVTHVPVQNKSDKPSEINVLQKDYSTRLSVLQKDYSTRLSVLQKDYSTRLSDSETKCTFNGTFEENFNKLKHLPFNNSLHLMDELGFSRVPNKAVNRSLPVLVTGINSEFYGVVQGLVKTIHKKLMTKYPDMKFIIYDMGMSDWQYAKVVKYCRCEVRKLPFDLLPKHVQTLGNFAFKPIIVNYVFQEFGHVWWVDSSVRFTSNELEGPLKYLGKNGALFFTYGPILNVALHTRKETFRYFEEDPCPYMYFGEIEAGNVAFINNEVGRLILNRWVSCALDASCITPKGANTGCYRSPKIMDKKNIATCHRYDQSALSVILRRLYHEQNDYPLVENPFRIIQVMRGQVVNYFPKDD